MITYLAQKYIANSFVFFAGLIIFPLSFGYESGIVAKAIFWGGLFGGFYTFYDFRSRNIWPLFNNLNYPGYMFLTGFFILLQVLSFTIRLFV